MTPPEAFALLVVVPVSLVLGAHYVWDRASVTLAATSLPQQLRPPARARSCSMY